MERYSYACISLTGNVRNENQDRYLCLYHSGNKYSSVISGESENVVSGICEKGIFAVFDGIGGGSDGEKAAEICAEYLAENADRVIKKPSDIIDVYTEVNGSVCNYANKKKLSVCGTTAATVIVQEDMIYISNIGDSRIYFSDKGLNLVSVEHISVFNNKRLLTQFIGIPEDEMIIEPHFCAMPKKEKSRLLICSDGLTDMVEESKIAEILSGNETVDKKCCRLADEAITAGGRDNITIIVLEWKN